MEEVMIPAPAMVWKLLIIKSEHEQMQMQFNDLSEVSEYLQIYKDNYGPDTKFVIKNSEGPEIEVSIKYYFKDDAPLPAALQD